jgi:hypothetical protein
MNSFSKKEEYANVFPYICCDSCRVNNYAKKNAGVLGYEFKY